MALEELIVAWSKDRPAWQREVMRRVATGDVLTDDDYDQLVQGIVKGIQFPETEFGLGQLPQSVPEDLPVCLLSVEDPEHVNALASSEPLTFEPSGMTLVYGDNASGKSGYARLLKRITRSRHQEEILTDVFRDTALARPTATVSAQIGGSEHVLAWPEESRPELQRMLFYDAACGDAYIAAESDFPYRPSALFVMDGLIDACVAIRSRLDAKLVENGAATNDLPTVPDEARDTDAGRFLGSLSGTSSVDVLDTLIATLDASQETGEELRAREARLLSADTTKERHTLIRQGEKIAEVRVHLDGLQAVVGSAALASLQQDRAALQAIEEASSVLARSFDSEPLAGVGTSPWRELWESARRYSERHAYPDQEFPVVGQDGRCVLCQQSLNVEARERFTRFDSFVKDDVQVRLQQSRQDFNDKAQRLLTLDVLPGTVANILADLDATHSDLVAETRGLIANYEVSLKQAIDAHARSADFPQLPVDPSIAVTRLVEASQAALASAEALASPEGVQSQRAAVTQRRAEIELLGEIKKSRVSLVDEIARLKERAALEDAKNAAAHGPITRKVMELSEVSITEVVRDTFTRETDRLRLERVTIARTRADKGALLHQPKLVGARQQVTLPRVFSEGERTALGLAAFFTEAQLAASHSAIILDDPVTSLDHIRRGLVAARLASLAESRQVVVFTHDVAFVADLKREANGKGVPVAERTVSRSRAGERKPGASSTTHPWKAKDVGARLNELRRELARIRKECAEMDEQAFENAVAVWAGDLSETWERIFSQEIVGPLVAEGGVEVRPMMVKILARFSDQDQREFEASYKRVSQWARRHDKSVLVNYVAPEVGTLEQELGLVDAWFKRVRGYSS